MIDMLGHLCLLTEVEALTFPQRLGPTLMTTFQSGGSQILEKNKIYPKRTDKGFTITSF